MLHLPRVMFAAPGSGSGKTMITCGVLKAFCERGLNPASFKCGPDYIDPMFHTRVIGTPSRNLDTFFTDPQTTRYLFAKTARAAGISVLEGVMGIYDGLGGVSTKGSSYDLAAVTGTPVVLIVNARGMSLSVIPLIQGYLNYQSQCEASASGRIRGVILNQTTQMTCLLLKDEIEKQTGIRVYGYVPKLDDAVVESRHLGLVTPDEIEDLKVRLARLGTRLEQSLDLDGILSLAQEAEGYEEKELVIPESVRKYTEKYTKRPEQNQPDRARTETGKPEQNGSGQKGGTKCGTGPSVFQRETDQGSPCIAVARDEAFCFYYQDNLELLEMLGAKVVPFSPLRDARLPEEADGLILGGGYPELYAGQLSENAAMKASICKAIENGLPYLAECGGFMYLHQEMEDMEGCFWPMCGCIPGRAYRTQKLGRFGYITLEPRAAKEELSCSAAAQAAECANLRNSALCQDSAEGSLTVSGLLRPGEIIRAHEFHYFDSTDPGCAYIARKPAGKRTWTCMHSTGHSAAGYPHLYYWSNPDFAARFVFCAAKYGQNRESVRHSKAGKAGIPEGKEIVACI